MTLPAGTSRRPLAELKLVAGAELIPTAKRTATSLGALVGFSIDELDELNIAVAQACKAAIEQGRRSWGSEATLKLNFWVTDRGLEVDVQAAPARGAVDSREEHHRQHHAKEEELEQFAQSLIRAFVDDFQPFVRRDRVRFKMVKYLIGG